MHSMTASLPVLSEAGKPVGPRRQDLRADFRASCSPGTISSQPCPTARSAAKGADTLGVPRPVFDQDRGEWITFNAYG